MVNIAAQAGQAVRTADDVPARHRAVQRHVQPHVELGDLQHTAVRSRKTAAEGVRGQLTMSRTESMPCMT